MKAVVLPKMKGTFQAFNADHYANFGCKTCHGPEFKDPPDFLPHLKLKGGKLAVFSDKGAKGKLAHFMADKVVPDMAAALGEPPYDPKTNTGFGCGGCHTMDTNK